MTALRGVGVLVTRPEYQAMPLCRALEAEGAAAFRLPAIDILPTADRRTLLARTGNLDAFDLIVFVSANAVRFGASLLEQKRNLTLAAVGPATARALNQAGYRVSIVPRGGYDTENLLAHPRFQHLTGQTVLLVKGSGGRELLEAIMALRGATVEVAEVYQRRPAMPAAAELEVLVREFDAGAIHALTATSLAIVESLLASATVELRAHFERVCWLVPSTRIAEGVRGFGVGAPLLQAASAEDHDLVAALIRWRSSASGA